MLYPGPLAVSSPRRLLLEISELKAQPKPTSFTDPTLPFEEPKDRPETKFDTNFHAPEVWGV